MATTSVPVAARLALPAGRCGGCGSRHRVSLAGGYCPRCAFGIRREATRHVSAHPGRRLFGPGGWSS